jgi:trans-2,3-dihydro-3-hydroxyanthranilate isomerase
VIGTAVVLGRAVPLDRLAIETGVGVLGIELERDRGIVTAAVMEQPQPRFSPHPQSAALCAALGIEPTIVAVGDNGVLVGLVGVSSLEELAALAPDLVALGRIGGLDVLSVYWDSGADPVRVRVFCPWAGIAEDPGTGIAAGPLGVHLGRSLTILQGVELGRPSTIVVEVGADRPPRVGGAAVLVGRGHYELP